MITQTITNGLDSFTQKIKNIPTQTYIIFYIIIAVICSIYMFGERRRMVTQTKNNISGKRDKAIETFANYKQDLLDEYALTCQDDIQNKKGDDKTHNGTSVDDPYYNNLFIDKLLQQIPNDNVELIKSFLSNPKPDVKDLNIILDDYTKNLLKTTDKFIKENSETLQLNDTIITNYISLLNVNITSYFNTDISKNINNLLDTKEFNASNIVDEFVKEINYRLFFSLRNLSRKIYIKQCDNESNLTNDDNGLLNQDLSNEIKDQANYRKNILYVMTYLIGEDNLLKDEVQTEYTKLQNESIQPNSEKVLTNLRNASKNLTNPADYYSGKMTGEFDLGSSFANQYNNYIAKQSIKDLDMLINPVNSIDSLEKNTIKFLEKIQNKITTNSEQLTSKSPITNNFTNTLMGKNTTIFNNQIDTTNRGSLLVNSNSTRDSKNTVGNKHYNTVKLDKAIKKYKMNNKIHEGFENINQEEKIITEIINNRNNHNNNKKLNQLDTHVASNLTKTTNSLLKFVNAFINYLNENVLPLFVDSETRNAVLELFQQEENSIPFGLLLIGISVFLFFIQVSSS